LVEARLILTGVRAVPLCLAQANRNSATGDQQESFLKSGSE
jgi:hypothetical protein